MIDVSPEQKRHKPGPTDPTGAVTSGLQPGPLRGRDAPDDTEEGQETRPE